MAKIKYVIVTSTDTRKWARSMLYMGSLGAYLPDNVGVFKGVRMRAKLAVDINTKVKKDPTLHEVACPDEEQPKDAVEKPKEASNKKSDAKAIAKSIKKASLKKEKKNASTQK